MREAGKYSSAGDGATESGGRGPAARTGDEDKPGAGEAPRQAGEAAPLRPLRARPAYAAFQPAVTSVPTGSPRMIRIRLPGTVMS